MTTRTPTSGAFRPTRRRFPTPSADDFVLSLWTDDPALARRADVAGVERIGVDLERLGKAERQRGLGTWLSAHREEDLGRVGPELGHAALFARLNPLNEDSAREIEAVLALGAGVLMLPMVRTAREAREFVRFVAGRATVVLLVEHAEGLRSLGQIVAVGGVDEIHIGLNDLALSLGLRNRWQTLSGDLLLNAGSVVRQAGLRFGLGGIGRAGDNDLPVPADLVYAEYARTGATAALLSRSFFRSDTGDLADEIARTRQALAAWRDRSAAELAATHRELARRVELAPGW